MFERIARPSTSPSSAPSRHERRPGGKSPVHVGVDEVRVHEVGAAQRAPEAADEPRVEVPPAREPFERHRQLRVEGLRRGGRVVQADEADVEAALGEGRQERQQVPLGAADPADPVEVDDLHAGTCRATSRGNRRASASRVGAAQSASVKSHGTR